jgi:hypothetical protein
VVNPSQNSTYHKVPKQVGCVVIQLQREAYPAIKGCCNRQAPPASASSGPAVAMPQLVSAASSSAVLLLRDTAKWAMPLQHGFAAVVGT